eukprot:3353468-Lingulodinium_polyedra.AAC.1
MQQQHFASAHNPNSGPSRASPGAGPPDPEFVMEGCKAIFLNDLRESGIYFLRSDGTEHMP